eukprot:1880081-Rhodomonas_salina.1
MGMFGASEFAAYSQSVMASVDPSLTFTTHSARPGQGETPLQLQAKATRFIVDKRRAQQPPTELSSGEH